MSNALHVCSVPGCGIELQIHVLMCRAHWRRVPYPIRSKVWAAWEQYRCGQLGIEALRVVQNEATSAVVSKGGAQ